METKQSLSDNAKDLGIKLEGDLGHLQISTLSDDEDEPDPDKTIISKNVDGLASFPDNLVHSSNAPIFGHVAVAHSKHVQLGNNTHFHGPVTIKQIIQNKSGVENVSFTKTEEDIDPTEEVKHTAKVQEIPSKKYHIQTWHKVLITASCVIVLAVVFTLVLVLQGKSGKNESSSPHKGASEETSNDLLIAPNHLRIVSRTDWLAQPPEDESEMVKLRMPVPWVIITHTATESCHFQNECVLRVRLIQMFHIEARKWDDIGYNFLVGGDGSAYFGRGWDIQGAHTLGYNKYSIAIAFIGTFNNEPPPEKQLDACKKLIKLGVQLGKLSKDYKLFAHRQLSSTLSPGAKLFEIIKTWPHFVNDTSNVSALIPPY
ncbi:peptidoglycan-recognition protein SA isoform X2 [Amyelois transitella]|uniref:peptidoglycan-recognition protein SA isoform X2 n=1 Tax=Amyelois transitella TaxID=680683 RepID=UPI00067B3838|nr:peptidoglycan-recognition protein SA isoform X2 [Amyelois transitella]